MQLFELVLLVFVGLGFAVFVWFKRKAQAENPKEGEADSVEVTMFGETFRISKEEAEAYGLKPNKKRR